MWYEVRLCIILCNSYYLLVEHFKELREKATIFIVKPVNPKTPYYYIKKDQFLQEIHSWPDVFTLSATVLGMVVTICLLTEWMWFFIAENDSCLCDYWVLDFGWLLTFWITFIHFDKLATVKKHKKITYCIVVLVSQYKQMQEVILLCYLQTYCTSQGNVLYLMLNCVYFSVFHIMSLICRTEIINFIFWGGGKLRLFASYAVQQILLINVPWGIFFCLIL